MDRRETTFSEKVTSDPDLALIKSQRSFKMIIKCILSVSLENVRYYSQQFSELPPLAGYITQKGPYVNNKEGASHQIITLYEFERSKLKEAWKNILKQMDSFCGIPGFTLSAHILEKAQELNHPMELDKKQMPV